MVLLPHFIKSAKYHKLSFFATINQFLEGLVVPAVGEAKLLFKNRVAQCVLTDSIRMMKVSKKLTYGKIARNALACYCKRSHFMILNTKTVCICTISSCTLTKPTTREKVLRVFMKHVDMM